VSKEVRDDRLSDLARIGWPGHDRGVGGIFVSAEIIQFIRGPKHDREQSDFPTIAFRSAKRPDDLVMDHADTATSEDVPSIAKPGHDGLAAAEA
jgi:hypothetical protein